MNVLVTGGAGFIGSHLCRRLLAEGQRVAVVDNLSTGSFDNISAFRENPSFSFTEGDIRDDDLLDPLVEGCGQVYHLAAAVGVRLIADDPVHTIETNIAGTQQVLESAAKYKTRTLIASSSEVYGKSEDVPFGENDDIVLGSTSLSRWSYACSKAIDEFLGLAFYRQFGLPVVIARLFNTIGPRQTGSYGMVVPRFVERALAGEPLEIYGSGRQSRCFCYVDDVVDAITGLMACSDAAGGVFNVGSQEEVTIEDLADRIIATAKSKSTKSFLSYEKAYGRPIEDMMRRVPKLDRIKQATGWRPATGLDEALKKIIAAT
jgi:UDP-glucose 4-epimerase